MQKFCIQGFSVCCYIQLLIVRRRRQVKEMQPPQPQKPEMLRFQPTVWDTVAKWCFYIHLTVSALLATVIIILHPIIRRPSIAFATLIIYGYLIVLLALIHMTMMCLNKIPCSIWFSRVGIKILITIYPLLAILIFKFEEWVWLCPHLAYFLIYLGIFSVIYIFYELGAYFCCERTNPDWIYKVSPSELQSTKKQVKERRKQFIEHTQAITRNAPI